MTHRTCSKPDCANRHVARGLCRKHYNALAPTFSPTPCNVIGCERHTTAKSGKGMCEMHYARQRRTGTVAEGKFYKPWLTPAEVLWERSEPVGECILWTGATSPDGYGIVGSGWGTARPHRFSWSLVNGPIPDGIEIDHTCHNRDRECVAATCVHRRCINPDHLEAVTHDENMERMFQRIA